MMNIDTILAVLGPTETQWTIDNPVVSRGIQLARRVAARLVLLQIGYDNSLGHGALAPRAEIDSARLALLASYREHLQELRSAVEASSGLAVDTVVKWSDDVSACIEETARERDADLILKLPEGHTFVLGLLPNTDWDLLRQSHVPVWFVSAEPEADPGRGVVAAVDQEFASGGGDDDEQFTLDHRAFDAAEAISRWFGSPLYAVHAYRVPQTLPGFASYAPTFPPAPSPIPLTVPRRQIAEHHGELVRDFVAEHGIPLDDLVVEEGPVDQVLVRAAEDRHAGLIVMGAANKTWWDRLLGRVSAEPTLAEAPCDVMFVRA